MITAINLVAEFLRTNDYKVGHFADGTSLIIKIDSEGDITETIVVASFTIQDRSIHVGGDSDTGDPGRQFDLYNEQDFDRMLAYLKQRTTLSNDRFWSTHTKPGVLRIKGQ